MYWKNLLIVQWQNRNITIAFLNEASQNPAELADFANCILSTVYPTPMRIM